MAGVGNNNGMNTGNTNSVNAANTAARFEIFLTTKFQQIVNIEYSPVSKKKKLLTLSKDEAQVVSLKVL